MIIVSISNCEHDNAVAVADDYQILAAIQKERITRVKGDGSRPDVGSIYADLVAEALRIAGVSPDDVDQVVTSRGVVPFTLLRQTASSVLYHTQKLFGKTKLQSIARQMEKQKSVDLEGILNKGTYLEGFGLPGHLPLMDSNHHYAHALSALFFTDWDQALLYTADGGGDRTFYSAYHFHEGQLDTLYGGDEEMLSPRFSSAHSVGQVYGTMTEALGYRRNRHEGKLTGLAAYGKPLVCDEIKRFYTVRDDGLIETSFKSKQEMKQQITRIGQSVSPADAAASVQKFLEDTVLASINIFLQKTNAKRVGLAGGVFANVALNRRIADLPDVEEIFIFPGMGDEGLAVGGVYDFLLRRDGMDYWQSRRSRLRNVYWGGDHDASALFAQSATPVASNGKSPAQIAAALLAEGKIVAIYHGRMEFGPRALGARSILASPTDAGINQSLNDRLQRTEFMPFAPYVLEEDADELFEITPANRYAMSFMTITTQVREAWRDKIAAVVHVDGTARPQIVRDEDNPLYAQVLREFKGLTGLRALVNTSFNVHEEPIIHTPKECLRALDDGRVDYVLLANGVYESKNNRDS